MPRRGKESRTDDKPRPREVRLEPADKYGRRRGGLHRADTHRGAGGVRGEAGTALQRVVQGTEPLLLRPRYRSWKLQPEEAPEGKRRRARSLRAPTSMEGKDNQEAQPQGEANRYGRGRATARHSGGSGGNAREDEAGEPDLPTQMHGRGTGGRNRGGVRHKGGAGERTCLS